ncbi:MAG: hypothetical protein QOF56_3631 [Acidobacteriaceae bacterium]|nr:hypothetical protein [Acidobacteriaceae bacterium]
MMGSCVLERICVVVIAYENVKGKRDVDGQPSPVQGEFDFVSIVDISVGVSWFGRL